MKRQCNFAKLSTNRCLLSALLICVLPLIPTTLSAKEMPADVKQAFEKAAVTEDDMLNGPGGARMILMGYMKENWAFVFDHLEEVAPTRLQKAVLIRASESLDAREYFVFLKTMKKYRESGRLSAEEFDEAIFPSRYKSDFLPYNYQNPEIRAFVESLGPLLPAGRHNLNDIISGKMMKNIEENRNGLQEGEFDSKLLLSPAEVTDRRVSPPKRPSDNPSRQGYTTPTSRLSNANESETDPKPTERDWLIRGFICVAAIAMGILGFVVYRIRKRKI